METDNAVKEIMYRGVSNKTVRCCIFFFSRTAFLVFLSGKRNKIRCVKDN